MPIIRNDKSVGKVHSSAISEVSIYKNGDSTLYPLNTAGSSSPSFIDNKLADFLTSVNKKDVSKVVDENGEPLVVYHGSDNTFFVFDRTKSRANADIQGNFFSPWEDDAQGYGANVRAFFLNIKNPANESSGYGALKKFSGQNQSGIKAREELIAQGYDGVNNEDAEFIAFNSNQIKSATDNIGTYSENPDIRFSLVSTGGNLDVIDPARGLSLAELYRKALKLHKRDFDGDLVYKDKSKMIFAETGWEYDEKADRWQYDLWEGKIKIPEGFKANWKGKVSDFFPDTKLFEVYPQLKDMSVIVKPLKASGMYQDGKIYLSNNYAFAPDKFKDDIHEVLIHEVQHAIQHIENMATGGSPTAIRQILQVFQVTNKMLFGILFDKERSFITPEEITELENFVRLVRNTYRLDDYYYDVLSMGASQLGKFAKKLYYALKGEREANNAGYRMRGFDKETPISVTEGYALDDRSHDWDSIYIDEKTSDLLLGLANKALKVSSDARKLADMKFSFAETSPERIKKLKNAETVVIGKDDYKGLYELNAKSARNYILKNLRGKKYIVEDNGDEVEISQVGARKLLSHDRYNEDYLRSFVKIPEMIENSIFLGEEQNQKHNDKYEKYRYYACGLNIGGVDYTARLTIGQLNGNWYYDQALTQIEKGDLIEQVLTLNSRVSLQGSPDGFIDNRLISLLQENNNGKANFSFADDNLHQKKRELAVELAKKLYARLGEDFDPTAPEAFKETTPTEDERAEIYMADMGMLDEDVDFVCDRAQAILWKLINGAKNKKSLQNDFDSQAIKAEKSFEFSRVIEACVKDAIKNYKKDLDFQEKLEKIRQREEDKKLKSVKPFTTDELAINGIDLIEAVCGNGDIDQTVDIEFKIVYIMDMSMLRCNMCISF